MKKKHNEDIGCNVQFIKKQRSEDGSGKGSVLLLFECLTHSIEVCRCGYEWGKHPKLLLRINHPYLLLEKILKKNI